MDEEVRLYSPGALPRVVAIGGGHGLSTMLRGLKRYVRDITAIVIWLRRLTPSKA